jgi:hypothetical protein
LCTIATSRKMTFKVRLGCLPFLLAPHHAVPGFFN